METEKNTFDVQLAGVRLRLKTSHEREVVDQLVEYVNGKIEAILAVNSEVSFQKALLLASLHIAEDFVVTKKSALAELDSLESKARDILSDLESSPIARIRMDN